MIFNLFHDVKIQCFRRRQMFHGRQRKARDVVGQPLDARGVLRRMFRKQPRNHRAAMMVKDALADHAHAAQPRAFVVRGAAENFLHDGAKLVCHRPHPLLDQRIQRRRRLDHFARHELALPCRRAFVKNPQQKRKHERAQFFLRRRVGGNVQQRRIFFVRPAVRIAQHLRVKRLLVAEMVVDGGDVRARAPADFAHRCVAEAGLGKHRARRLQKLAAGLGRVRAGGSGWRLRFHFQTDN